VFLIREEKNMEFKNVKHTLALNYVEIHAEINDENLKLRFFHVLILHLIFEYVHIQFPVNGFSLFES
jgi:hypothetical protein